MTALSVGNAGSLVTRTIDQAKSKDLMLRELFQNALEAASKQTVGKKKIQIKITDPAWFGISNYYSSKKFGIVNTGPGMSAINLRRATDLSSSIAKIQSLHENFGEGGKVACLPVNKSGMIWVSCHNGEVNMVILRLAPCPLTKEERYERQDFMLGDGTTTDVIDITPLFTDQALMIKEFGSFTNPSGLDTSEDWTYIVLCGNDRNQDTTINPYGDRNNTGAWALNELYKRFSTIPSDIEVTSEIHSKGKSRKVVPFTPVFDVLKDRASKTPDKVRIETVSIPETTTLVDIGGAAQNGTINITYVYDGPYGAGNSIVNSEKPTSVISNTATCPIFSGIIFKNEIYDVRGGSEGTSTWQPAAKDCGILYGYKYCRVYVHIPTSTDIVTDRYRTSLMTNTYDKKPILFTHYKHEIYNNMPEWFIDKMKEFAPDTANIGDVYKELNDLWEKTQLKTSASKINTTTAGTISGTISLNKKPTGNRGGTRGSTNTGNMTGAVLLSSISGKQRQVKPFPNIEVLKEKDIKTASVSPNFEYKAAEYAIDRNILFINATYPVIDMIIDDLLSNYPDASDEISQLAYDTSISLVTKLAGTGLIYGLAKQGKPGYEDDFEKAIDPACLSTHADKWIEHIEQIRKKFERDVAVLEMNLHPAKVA
jgi:hypothetical protein